MDVKAMSADGHSVLVSWLPPSSPNGRLTRYSVYMRTMEGGRQFTQHFEVAPDQTNFAVRGLNQVKFSYHLTKTRDCWLTIFFVLKNQPYSFWVRASTSAGDGPESQIVSETPQTPVAATLASFSRLVIAAVKEEAVLDCVAVGQPKPDRQWSHELVKYTVFAPTEVTEYSMQYGTILLSFFLRGSLLAPSHRFHFSSDGESLRISPLELGDAGNYSCDVSNHFGRDRITYALDVRRKRSISITLLLVL